MRTLFALVAVSLLGLALGTAVRLALGDSSQSATQDERWVTVEYLARLKEGSWWRGPVEDRSWLTSEESAKAAFNIRQMIGDTSEAQPFSGFLTSLDDKDKERLGQRPNLRWLVKPDSVQARHQVLLYGPAQGSEGRLDLLFILDENHALVAYGMNEWSMDLLKSIEDSIPGFGE
jgi:hypothetical protein